MKSIQIQIIILPLHNFNIFHQFKKNVLRTKIKPTENYMSSERATSEERKLPLG